MDDKKLLDMIRESAEDAEIPESLKPDVIWKKLEEQYKKEVNIEEKKETDVPKTVSVRKRIPFQRYGIWAAAAVLFLALAVGVAPVLKRQNPISHIESYEALYDMIKESRGQDVVSYEKDTVYGGEISTNVSMNMEVEESAPVMESAQTADTDTGATVPETAAEESGYSTTNTQEERVDEADIVKTDGTYIYALDEEGTVRIVEAASLELLGEIPDRGDSSSQAVEMYVDGDILQIIRSELDYKTYEKDSSYYSVPEQTTVVTTYDISDRSRPVSLGTYRQDGSYLSSRKNGAFLYLFTCYYPESGPDALAKEFYVPKSGDDYLPYDEIYLPVQKKYNGEAYLVASSIENSGPGKAVDCMAVVSGGENFYVSEQNIYAAASDWDGSENKTDIVRFGYKDGIFTPGCSGRIPGTLNDNFSMDEYKGNLRLVSTVEAWEEFEADGMTGNSLSRTNSLYVLDMDLQIQGKIEDLAEGEEIKSARFFGETGYFVTYRNTDPLFSVDLSDPEHPEILGELKVTGFSGYLHFYGEDQLLGIGWETEPETGVQEGLKCSMFDLSDPEDVKEVDRLILPYVFVCDALSNYKAILADPQKNLFGFAYGLEQKASGYKNNESNEKYYYGVFSYEKEKGFVPLKYINVSDGKLFSDGMTYLEHRDLRGIYIGDTFYLVCGKGIEAYDMTEDFAWKDVLLW